MTAMSQLDDYRSAQLRLLHYDCDRSMVRAYWDSGRDAWVGMTRQGNRRISLNGGGLLCIRDGLAQIERVLIKSKQFA